MIDLEISKALALAIGHKKEYILELQNPSWLSVYDHESKCWRTFDYRDWRIIGPIAEKYGCFPTKLIAVPGWWAEVRSGGAQFASTPQKAIALAVIGAKK
jgi:hypothetical protein